MKKVRLSEARAMLTEILAARSGGHRFIPVALALGTSQVSESGLRDLDELAEPFRLIAQASHAAQNGIIAIDENAWRELEGVYYNRVTKHLLF
jgi:hypothetical protein